MATTNTFNSLKPNYKESYSDGGNKKKKKKEHPAAKQMDKKFRKLYKYFTKNSK
jgi:aromatic ring hydroxylase